MIFRRTYNVPLIARFLAAFFMAAMGITWLYKAIIGILAQFGFYQNIWANWANPIICIILSLLASAILCLIGYILWTDSVKDYRLERQL